MRNKHFKLGVSVLLLITLLLPNTIAMAADSEETSWTTLASMSTPRIEFKTETIDGKIYAIGGVSGSKIFESSTEVYDPSNDTWTSLASMSTPRFGHQTEVIDDKIYAIGGYNGSTYLSSVEVYDPVNDTWTSLASMSTPRLDLQTEVIDGKIYAIGGQNNSSLSSVEIYDPSNDTWTSLASMSTPRLDLQTEVIDGKIYAIGGSTGITRLSSVEVYDPSNDTWTSLTSMSTPHYNCQTEVINGKIYAIGGYGSNSIEVYDPSNDTSWAALASMSTLRYNYQTEVINGKIYAIGGQTGVPSLPSVEVYDPSIDTWTSLASMSTPRYHHQTEVINGKIYALGGMGTNSSYLSSMETYDVTSSRNKLKVVLEVNETLQLSIDDNLSQNTNVTWSSSNSSVASVDENGVVTALATGNAIITVSDGASYTASINILVVENADTHRLAIDLQVGNTSRLTVDDYTNTATATWASSDPSIAIITNAGRVTAASAGLTLITATDEADNQIGQAYIRVRA